MYIKVALHEFWCCKKSFELFQRRKIEINNHLNDLSKSEHEILELLAQGLLYKEIADKKDVTIDNKRCRKHLQKTT
jgi:DNA-binding NarL/FixJ family response regulator